MFNQLLFTKPNPFDFKSIFGNMKSEWYYYVTLVAFIALFTLILLSIKKQRSLSLTKTQKITLTSVLTALTVIANVFTFGPDNSKISLMPASCFVAGYVLGPYLGFSVAFIGDLIAGIIAPQGAYNGIIAIASSLWGLVPGIVYRYFKGNGYLKAVISFVVCFIVCSLGLNTLGMYLMYFRRSAKYTVYTYFLARLPIAACMIIINTGLSVLLIPVLEKIKNRLSSMASVKCAKN